LPRRTVSVVIGGRTLGTALACFSLQRAAHGAFAMLAKAVEYTCDQREPIAA
jgi:hypothetical protein